MISRPLLLPACESGVARRTKEQHINIMKQPTSAIQIPAEIQQVVASVKALDRFVHEPIRLRILMFLARRAEEGNEEVAFHEVERALGLKSGYLSTQAAKLQAAGYLSMRKWFQGLRPATSYALTASGQAALATYWVHMGAILRFIAQQRQGGTEEEPSAPGEKL